MSGTLQIGGLHISLSMSQAEFLAAAKTAEGAMNRLAGCASASPPAPARPPGRCWPIP